MDVNKITLIGNLVRDPDIKESPSGSLTATFSVATLRVWREEKSREKREAVEYHQVLATGRLAEIVGQYVKKGHKVYLEGRLQTVQLEANRRKHPFAPEVVCNNLILLSRKN